MPRKPSPLSLDNPLFVAAVTMHEMFLAYVQAGFTRAEALQLVSAQITAQIISTQEKTDGTED